MELLGNFTTAQNLDAVERTMNESGSAKELLVDGSAVFETLFERIEIDHSVERFEVLVIEAALGKATRQRHLTAFETGTDASAGTCLLTFMALARSLAVAGAFAATYALTAMFRAGIVF